MDMDEIEDLLDLNNPESHKHWEQIVRETGGRYTVALFDVSVSTKAELLELAGTGTLVSIGDSHFILTATHVWEKRLKKASVFGMSLREDLDHRCLMEPGEIADFGLPKPKAWNEWGPDLVLLRIPPARVGEIKAFRSFYPLPTAEKAVSPRDRIETHFLLGTPHSLGLFTPNHASVQIVGFQVASPVRLAHDGFDYLDVRALMPPSGTTKSFGGVSGGGLWKVYIYSDPSTGEISSVETLEGVAFFEGDAHGDQRIIRCHGMDSIRMAMSSIIT